MDRTTSANVKNEPILYVRLLYSEVEDTLCIFHFNFRSIFFPFFFILFFNIICYAIPFFSFLLWKNHITNSVVEKK